MGDRVGECDGDVVAPNSSEMQSSCLASSVAEHSAMLLEIHFVVNSSAVASHACTKMVNATRKMNKQSILFAIDVTQTGGSVNEW